MKQYLLDTNVCAYLLRGKYGVKEKIKAVGLVNCHISIISYAELYYGCESSYDFNFNLSLLNQFCQSIDIIGIDRIVPTFAKEKARLRAQGRLIEDFDILIGATAIDYDMTLVTENIKHLSRLRGISIENWINR